MHCHHTHLFCHPLTNPSSISENLFFISLFSPVGLTPEYWVGVYLSEASSPHSVDLRLGEVDERVLTGLVGHWAKEGSLSPTPPGPPRQPFDHEPERNLENECEWSKLLTVFLVLVLHFGEQCSPWCRLWPPPAGMVWLSGSTGRWTMAWTLQPTPDMTGKSRDLMETQTAR